MSYGFAHGSFDWLTTDPVSTVYTITTGLRNAKAFRFYWVGLQSTSPTDANSQAVAERRGVGFADDAGNQQCVGTFAADNSGNADCGSAFFNGRCVVTVDGTGTIDGSLTFGAVGVTNFTISVSDVTPANLTIFWEAWGGTDIQAVTIGSIAEPAATGTQTYTATGFITGGRDQCVMFAGVQSTAASGTGQAQDSGLHVGFATSTATTRQITVCGNSDDGSATMDTDGYNITGECVSMILIAGGNPNARATLSAFGTNTFTLNWLARATTNRRSIYMAIKGGGWQAGNYNISGNVLNAATAVIGIPFTPIGLCLLGAMKTQSTVATSTAEDRIGFGTAAVDETARQTFTTNSAGILDENGTANSEIDTSISYQRTLVFPSNAGALQSAYTLSGGMGPERFTVIVSTAGGVANEWQGYLVFGPNKNRVPVSIGHPFIA